MKRYNMIAKPWDYRSADVEPVEATDGFWMPAVDGLKMAEEIKRLERIEAAAKAMIDTYDTPGPDRPDDHLQLWLDAVDNLRAALEAK